MPKRTILLVRHAYSGPISASYAEYDKAGGPIIEKGVAQAEGLGRLLALRGVDVTQEPVAVSEMLRTRQTAERAGFTDIRANPLLNEVNTADPQRTLTLVTEGKLPEEAIAAARAILANPPPENIWVTHGLPMAALLVELGLSDSEHFIPGNCEIRGIQL
ncbi:MAG TPA: phosphoglycerate mutase family protein [Candidatus Saccharimonadales bacterium]|jgi:broad specificity phosphatase PhoE